MKTSAESSENNNSLPQKGGSSGIDIFPNASPHASLRPLLLKIKDVFSPSAILLFGSRARGDSRSDSDWDLLILLPPDAPEDLLDPFRVWEVKQGTKVKADILCEYEDEFLASIDVTNTLAYEVRDHAIRIG